MSIFDFWANGIPERRAAAGAVLTALLAAGCRQDMHDHGRLKPLEESAFFRDGRSARPIVAGTVARGELREDELLHTGLEGGKPVDRFPERVTLDMLQRGRERYEIYCSPCHDRTGGGQGIVVLRGFRRPPSFHGEELRKRPAGHFVDVITRGFGVMQDLASQVAPRDRWAIAAYIRALQRSQKASRADVPPQELARLGAEGR